MLKCPMEWGQPGLLRAVYSPTEISFNLLLCNPVERGLVVESKVAGMDDVVCSRLSRKVVERAQVTYQINISLASRRCEMRRGHSSYLVRRLCTKHE